MITLRTEIPQRVRALLHWMEEEGFDAFVVPTTDPHDSEYTPDHWKTRTWLTGFDGSAGTAVLTTTGGAALWTDSRYFLQAADQLASSPFTLMREGEKATPSIAEWIAQQLPDGGTVGYPADMVSIAAARDLADGLDPKLRVRPSDGNPFDLIWEGRPAVPANPLDIVPDEEAGRSAREKLQMVWEAEKALCPQATRFLVNDLSEIAWILNLRGSDIEFNPVFVAYMLLEGNRTTLFTDERRLTPEVVEHLRKAGVATSHYKAWKGYLSDLAPTDVVGLPASMNMYIVDFCRENDIAWCEAPWQVPLLRSVKTPQEQDGFRRAMLRDGVAMVKFLRWLDECGQAGKLPTEVGVDEKLTSLRAEQPGFCGLSFGTIAGYGAHGAIVHYEATPETDVPLQPKGLLLLDSGAHYDCGTTDITRTIALGPLTEEERKVYTLVLKGHIALSSLHFPQGSTGLQLDTAARFALWSEGYDFGHGTGHGVGHRLCVHEGPQQIRKNLRACTTVPFAAGMTITDEPGCYVEGHFGVRIENTLLVVPAGQTAFGTFFAFEPLTLCPIDLRPIDRSLLQEEEIEWINTYHATVRERLMPLLTDEADRQWLAAATRALK